MPVHTQRVSAGRVREVLSEGGRRAAFHMHLTSSPPPSPRAWRRLGGGARSSVSAHSRRPALALGGKVGLSQSKRAPIVYRGMRAPHSLHVAPGTDRCPGLL